MPSNITAKNAAAADVVFTAVAGAAGNSPAIWRALTLGTVSVAQAILSLVGRESNGSKPGRRVELTLEVPYTVVDPNGVITTIAKMPFIVQATRPANMPDAAVNDAVAYFASIIPNAQVVAAFKSGFATT
jgi:hypothetical protein